MDKIDPQLEKQIEENYMILIECALSGRRLKLPPKKLDKPKKYCACGEVVLSRGMCSGCYWRMYRAQHKK